MKKSRFTDEQIVFALRRAEGAMPVREVCRKLGVSEQTLYRPPIPDGSGSSREWDWPKCASSSSWSPTSRWTSTSCRTP